MLRLFFYLLLCTISGRLHAAGLQWVDEYSKAESLAEQNGKLLFVYFYADWCDWCKKLEREVFEDPTFIRYLQGYVPVRLDFQKAGSAISNRYGVKSIPTTLILEPSGRAVNRIAGYLNTQQFISDLAMMQDLITREQNNPEDWHIAELLGEEFLFRDLNEEAEIRFTRVLNALAPYDAKESAHFALALSRYYQEKTDQALKTLKEYLEIYEDGPSAPDAMLLISQILLERNGKDEAKQMLQEFLNKYPDNSNAPRAREALRKL